MHRLSKVFRLSLNTLSRAAAVAAAVKAATSELTHARLGGLRFLCCAQTALPTQADRNKLVNSSTSACFAFSLQSTRLPRTTVQLPVSVDVLRASTHLKWFGPSARWSGLTCKLVSRCMLLYQRHKGVFHSDQQRWTCHQQHICLFANSLHTGIQHLSIV